MAGLVDPPDDVPTRSAAQRLMDALTVVFSRLTFGGSARYWDLRYRLRGSSGAGSYGATARLKADFVNRFIAENDVMSVVDFGCGDGAQLELLNCPHYLGVDVSRAAVARCRERFRQWPGKHFITIEEYQGEQADVAMSLDVIYHLVEDDVFDRYLDRLFAAARRFVVIYSTDHDEDSPRGSTHVRHRALRQLCLERFPAFDSVDPPFSQRVEPTSARFLVFQKGG